MNLYIIGYMGTGKSKFGAALAELTGSPYIDLDDLFESRYHISISDFFDKYGEAVFRDLERQLLFETGIADHAIISTGGGTPCYMDNMDFMLQHGKCIYLKQDVQVILDRVTVPKRKRPILKNVPPDELEDFITRHLSSREPFYNRADLILEGQEADPAEALVRLKSLDFLQ
ncbi:MAG: shikimate kinase [Syntrophothermus sp.]